jgi:hypothetical protein
MSHEGPRRSNERKDLEHRSEVGTTADAHILRNDHGRQRFSPAVRLNALIRVQWAAGSSGRRSS